MIKIITALGNPSLNTELKKYSEFEVIGNKFDNPELLKEN